jgi:peptide deformylase
MTRIVQVPNPVLITHTKKVTVIDKKVLDIIDRMKKTLSITDNPKGVGLAATQIGISLSIFITRPRENSVIRAFINPQIIWKSDELSELVRDEGEGNSIRKEKKLEGCLSINNIWGHLLRASHVKLRYLDPTGQTKEEKFSGFMATIIQHEVDHLNGILFTQRVMEQKEKLYEIHTNDKGEEKLVEIEI